MPRKFTPNKTIDVDETTIGVLLSPSQKICLVDKTDYDLIKDFRWILSKNKYAITTIPKSNSRVLMHRLILSLQKTEAIDHVNRNGLDNRKCNLRFASSSQNMSNRKKFSNTASKYKGVSRSNNRYIARISINSETIYLGIFETEENAAEIYNRAAKKYFGEFACLNEIKNIQEPIRKITSSASGYLGVSKLGEKRYQARIGLDRKCHSLGVFSTAEQAALAYNKKALEFFKEKAKLNLIK